MLIGVPVSIAFLMIVACFYLKERNKMIFLEQNINYNDDMIMMNFISQYNNVHKHYVTVKHN